MYSLKDNNEKPIATITKLNSNFEKLNDNPNIPCGYSYKMKYSNWNIDAFLAIHSCEMKNEIQRIVENMMEQAKDLEM